MVLAQLPLLSVWYLFILLPRWGWEKLHLYQAALHPQQHQLGMTQTWAAVSCVLGRDLSLLLLLETPKAHPAPHMSSVVWKELICVLRGLPRYRTSSAHSCVLHSLQSRGAMSVL